MTLLWTTIFLLVSAESFRLDDSPFKIRHDQLCTSVECLETAFVVKSAMNFSANPCENFENFVCGRFQQVARIPDDKTGVSEVHDIQDDLYDKARDMLEEGDEGWELDKKVKQYYKDCMDEEAREEAGSEPAAKILEQAGGWPVLGKENNKEWYEIQQSLFNLGLDLSGNIISSYVYADFKDTEKRILYLDQPSFGLSREYLASDKGQGPEVDAYLEYMADTAVYFGADRTKAEKDMAEVLKFETELAKASDPKEARRDKEKLYNVYTLESLERAEGHPPSWKDYLESLLGIELDVDEKVVVQNPKYLRDVANILTRTDKRVINNYLLWLAARSSMGTLDYAARDLAFKFAKALRGAKKQRPMWKRCVRAAGVNTYGQGLNLISSSMYVRKYFKDEAKDQMLKIIDNVRESFRTVLTKLDWMDEETKKAAFTKLEEMLQGVAYPDEIVDQEAMDELHKGLELKEGDFYGSSIAITKFWSKWYYGRLRSKISRQNWLDNPALAYVAVVNAFYSSTTNTIAFPAGFLSGLMFNAHRPQYMNYGGIGAIIGHEISHGFDDQGRQTDERGLLRNWWSEDTLSRFHEKAKCVIDQYSGFEDKQVGLKLNGVNSQGENIADIVGYKLAYMGYELWMQEHGTEPGLPGLPFTPRQMFWISRARSYCSKTTDEALRNQILTGYHVPDSFRTIGPLMNLHDFARDFNCPVGSMMNPKKKCNVW